MHPDHLLEMKNGLDSQTAAARLEALGPNFIEVTVPTFLHALWEELTGFFYLYQLQILWCYFYLAYWQIGLSDTCVILLAALIKVIVRIKSEKKIKSMAEHTSTCQVLRDGQWQTDFSTMHLLPGDVFRVEPHHIVPVDAVILSGDIVVDESSLTGEPLPIRKFPLRHQQQQQQPVNEKAMQDQSLFSETVVVEAANAIALVLKTRTDTDKGQLIQRILFPQMVSFIFNEQLKVVFGILLLWAIVLLAFGSWWLGGTGMTAWFYGMTCAAQVMNPLLPAILVVGQSVAAGRLKKKGIYCVDFPRILMAGKVQVFCFDKTGTLTNEGLEYYGVHPCIEEEEDDAGQKRLDALYPRYSDLSAGSEHQRLLQMGLASCHSVTVLEDEYIGNPVDIVMFQSTQAKLVSRGEEDAHDTIVPPAPLPTLQVLQQFEFQHARASMSVVVKDTRTGHSHVFCKGSFERMAEISQRLPSNFEHVTTVSARQGCYVLGMAHRDLGILTEEEEMELCTHGSRDDIEAGVEFLGLVLFKNVLKKDTAAAIHQLKEGDVRTVMITGDTVLTGVFIGQQCGLADPHTPVVVGDMVPVAVVNDEEQLHLKDETEKGRDARQQQQQQQQAAAPIMTETLVWYDSETHKRIDHVDIALANGSELALTGKAFRYLSAQQEGGGMRQYLFSTRIFARMTPIDKMRCVEMMMERAITAMCGDGGNDCGALKAAHVGIAMSEAEASVVSPFSTPHRSVQACVDLLIQGRSALATSFASYKYLIMYGETMACTKLVSFYYTLGFSQWNFILIDAFITVFCSFAVTQAGAARRLSQHRPTARLLGPEVVGSLVGHIVINAWFLIGALVWLYTQDDFFRCHEWDARATDASKWWLLGDSFEVDVLSFVVLFQFINAAMVFNYGYLFRQRWYRNYLLLVIWAVFVTIVSFWELADPNVFGCAVRLNCGDPDVLVQLGYPRPTWYIEPYNNPSGHNVLPRRFRYQLWAYSIGNMLTVHVWERWVILGPVRQWLRRRYPLDRLQVAL
ncbi:hypothetical protein BDF20DRAFT_907125 [Mycotypha africana]|uniref:uncharacterized protein n=1 Tax=Mycotypha africana TaxID=64632 RepID=UPI002300B6C4|nr:uncharacterized protein BDF20DRAFT_907125 [Mycotypha africana]KAI8973640.1 hypothetical protein BDF20DRAFT_907125 [Mycotypha africana]